MCVCVCVCVCTYSEQVGYPARNVLWFSSVHPAKRWYSTLKLNLSVLFSPHGATFSIWPGPPHSQGFTITLRHTALDRTPLDEGSARRRYLFLGTHDSPNRRTSMSPAGFASTIPASEGPQIHALDCTAHRDRRSVS